LGDAAGVAGVDVDLLDRACHVECDVGGAVGVDGEVVGGVQGAEAGEFGAGDRGVRVGGVDGGDHRGGVEGGRDDQPVAGRVDGEAVGGGEGRGEGGGRAVRAHPGH